MSTRLAPPRDGSYIPAQTPKSRMIIRPNEVRGMHTAASRQPDRYFYLLYGDTVWECDGYRIGPTEAPDDSPEVNWSILLVCPVCHNNLRIDSVKKHLQVERQAAGLDTEPIQCSYKAEFGGLCRFRVVLERPSRRSDREVIVDGRRIIIDAVAKDARK